MYTILDNLQTAMQTHVSLSQQLESLAKTEEPLLAEMANILLRDSRKVKNDLWSVTQCTAGENIEVLPIVPRYESSTFEKICSAKIHADRLADLINHVRFAKFTPHSDMAERTIKTIGKICDRLEKIAEIIADQEMAEQSDPNMNNKTTLKYN